MPQSKICRASSSWLCCFLTLFFSLEIELLHLAFILQVCWEPQSIVAFMFSCLHTVLSYLVSDGVTGAWDENDHQRSLQQRDPCVASLTCARRRLGLACWFSIVSSDFVTSVSGAFGHCLCSDWGQKKPAGAWARRWGSLKSSFSTCTRDALNSVCKPSLREHFENLGRVPCRLWDSYLRKCILPSIWFWEEVPCGNGKISFILEQMVGMCSLWLGQALVQKNVKLQDLFSSGIVWKFILAQHSTLSAVLWWSSMSVLLQLLLQK